MTRTVYAIQAELNALTADHARLIRAARNIVDGLCDEAPDTDADEEYIDLWSECWTTSGGFLHTRLVSIRQHRRALETELEDVRRPIYGPPVRVTPEEFAAFTRRGED